MKYSKEKTRYFTELGREIINPKATSNPTMKDLVAVLNFHEYRYYVLNDPLIADVEYDKLYQILKKKEEKNPEEIQENSPTRRVSPELLSGFNSKTHLRAMLSLDNSYNPEDLKDFDRKLKDASEESEVEYVVEPKFDGSSIAIVYENGRMIRATTRGDGQTGEEVTQNVRTISSIPLHIEMEAAGISRMEIRGEIVIRREVFEKINNQRAENGEKLLANARNSAAGALRVKDAREAKARGLDVFIYQIGVAEDKDGNDLLRTKLTSHSENMLLLAKLGFKVAIDQSKVCKDIEEVTAFIYAWEVNRPTYDYDTDGMVIKANRADVQEKAGETAHHPRWAIAFKFKAQQATTRLLEVEYQVGRTGAITPVAKVEPTYLAGVTVSSISLHNQDIIKQKDIRIGDTLLIERAGDVIPYVVKSLEELRTGEEVEIVFPENCPVCQEKIEKTEGEVVLRCVNTNCPAQMEEQLIHFVSKEAMDIDGLGKDIVRRLVKLGIIEKMEDIFNLDFDCIGELEGWGERSIQRLKAGIEKSKQNEAARLLYAMGIRHVGLTTAKILIKPCNHLLDLEQETEEKLQELPDVGPKVASSVAAFFQDLGNVERLKELERLGVNLTNVKEEALSSRLEGKTFLFTGTLTKMGRSEAKKIVESHGGKLVSSVSKNLNFLVAGEKAGSKLTKAETIPTITILTEQAFLDMTEE